MKVKTAETVLIKSGDELRLKIKQGKRARKYDVQIVHLQGGLSGRGVSFSTNVFGVDNEPPKVGTSYGFYVEAGEMSPAGSVGRVPLQFTDRNHGLVKFAAIVHKS